MPNGKVATKNVTKLPVVMTAAPANGSKRESKRIIQSAFSEINFKKKSSALLRLWNNAAKALKMVDMYDSETARRFEKKYKEELRKLLAEEEL